MNTDLDRLFLQKLCSYRIYYCMFRHRRQNHVHPRNMMHYVVQSLRRKPLLITASATSLGAYRVDRYIFHHPCPKVCRVPLIFQRECYLRPLHNGRKPSVFAAGSTGSAERNFCISIWKPKTQSTDRTYSITIVILYSTAGIDSDFHGDCCGIIETLRRP